MLAKLVIAATLATTGASAVAAADGAPDQAEEFHGRSSFWGNDRPAVNGAYRYRLLGIGVVLAGLTGLGMLRLVKKANAERAARDAAATTADEKLSA